MNQACHRGGKSLLNEQRACRGNSAPCCIAPRLLRSGAGEDGEGRTAGSQGCAGAVLGRSRDGAELPGR